MLHLSALKENSEMNTVIIASHSSANLIDGCHAEPLSSVLCATDLEEANKKF